MTVEIRHLRYFLAIAEELSFSRAAEKLRIAQPPLSQQIKQLENELGVQLIERETRPVRLTEAGKFFREQAQTLVSRFDELVQQMHKMGRGETGTLAIAFVASATFEVLPIVLREFQKCFPDVQLDLFEMNTSEQKVALLERRINLGFVRPDLKDESIIVEKLFEESIVLAVPSGHKYSDRHSINITDIAKDPLICFPRLPEPSFGSFILGVCRAYGFEPIVVQHAGELQTALSLVAGGMGIALLPNSIRKIEREGVVYLPLNEPVPKTTLSVAFRKDDTSPTLKSFLEILRPVFSADNALH
jgi:DNA-binding transcriptional LysR family regulator